MAEQQGFISFLTDPGVIRASGEDARHFLHNQLTNDIDNLGIDDARLAGYCSPKGRLLASLLTWPVEDAILLMLPRSLLPGVQKRLQMFVLRAKVSLEDISDSLAMVGISMPDRGNGRNDQDGQHGQHGQDFPSLPEAPYSSHALAGGRLIRLTDVSGLRRALWVGPAAQRDALLGALPAGLQQQPESYWRWLDIQAGVPQIREATREQFVPQMVNFELVGGVNFRKGCYPGQEIVARSQYLGKLKRRMLLASVDADDLDAATPGTEVFSDADPGQPAGMIVNAERGPEGRIACLVEIKMDAIDSPVHLGAASGPLLTFTALPYSLEATG